MIFGNKTNFLFNSPPSDTPYPPFVPPAARALRIGPFAEPLTEVVTVPKIAVENLAEAFLVGGGAFGRVCVRLNFGDGVAVDLRSERYILRRTGAAFYLQYFYAGIKNLVEKLNGTQVFGRHNVLVFDGEFFAGFEVGYFISATANLKT